MNGRSHFETVEFWVWKQQTLEKMERVIIKLGSVEFELQGYG